MNADAACRIDRLPQERVLEFVAFHWPVPGFDAAAWPCAPGGAVRDERQHLRLLHVAPGRWLLPEPNEATQALADSAARTGQGAAIDVTGKWERIAICGPGAARLLACAIEIHAVLDGRDCATVRLFDCPAVVARQPEGFALWVQSSYAGDFLATAGGFLATLQAPA